MESFNKSSLTNTTRIITFIGAIALFITIFVPIWKIELTAPQYPEGLEMFIHADKLSGEIDIINGLNHYIGMKELHADDFKEFTFLPYVIGFFGVLGLIVGITNKRKLFYVWVALFFAFAIAVVFDFYFWLQDYGSNLDPKAAIQVPGMTYDPPMLGYKQLLNFGAYSIPAIGGYLMLGVGIAQTVFLFLEIKTNRKK